MKRHGFHGLSASHGAQRKHRSPGSIGGCATPGRVFKGVRMAGRMGGERTTTPRPDRARGRRRARPAPDQGCRPRPQGRLILVRSAIQAPSPPRRRPRERHRQRRLAVRRQESQDVELPDEIFAAQVNVPLIHQVVVAQHAAARQGTHATKTRGEVRGGGRKPYRQKGTGRARQGSAPCAAVRRRWHGARPAAAGLRAADAEEDEGRRAPRRAVRPGPHGRVARGQRFVDGEAPGPRTRWRAARRAAGGCCGRCWSSRSRDDELTWKSLRNVPGVTCWPSQLNTYDVLVSDHVVFTQAALDEFTGHGGPARKEDEQ